MKTPASQLRPTRHRTLALACAAIALSWSSANAITRSETFECRVSNGGKFVLHSTYDYNPLGALNPHGSAIHDHTPFSVSYHPPHSFASIATDEEVRWANSRHIESPDGPGNAIQIRTSLCLGGKVVAGIPQFGSTLILDKKAVQVPTPTMPSLLADAATAARELDRYAAGGLYAGLTAYSMVGKQLVHEVALEDNVAVCKATRRSCLIRAVYRTVSPDMGATWGPWKFATESDVFRLGKAWDEQPILATQDRSDGIPGKAYEGLSPRTTPPPLDDPLAAAWHSAQPVQAVRALLDSGSAVDLQNGGGMTPLMYAVLAGHLEFAKELVKRGANVNAIDKVGDPVLTYAARSGNVELLDWLLAQGANPVADGPLKATVLTGLLAHWEGDWQQAAVDRLVSIPKALQPADASGTTALMYAGGRGLGRVVQALLANGADASATNKRGANALHFAALHGSPEVVAHLLQTNLNRDAQDATGKTPLHYAVISQRSAKVRLLIDAGAHTDIPDMVGEVPMNRVGDPSAKGEAGEFAREFSELLKVPPRFAMEKLASILNCTRSATATEVRGLIQRIGGSRKSGGTDNAASPLRYWAISGLEVFGRPPKELQIMDAVTDKPTYSVILNGTTIAEVASAAGIPDTAHTRAAGSSYARKIGANDLVLKETPTGVQSYCTQNR